LTGASLESVVFKKSLMANRGVRVNGAGVRSLAPTAQVSVAPHRLAREACAGDFHVETNRV
jgi:hypothetical protein